MDDELYHYGILGMKWGVRRYQNSDGTLTEAGKRRARKQERREQMRADRDARRAVRNDRKNAARNASLLSDQELNERINRLQRERTFKELSKRDLYPGRQKAGEIMEQYGRQAVGSVVGIGVAATAGKMINANMDKWMSTQGYYTKNYVDGVPKNKETRIRNHN